jgi:hypothetical protein
MSLCNSVNLSATLCNKSSVSQRNAEEAQRATGIKSICGLYSTFIEFRIQISNVSLCNSVNLSATLCDKS